MALLRLMLTWRHLMSSEEHIKQQMDPRHDQSAFKPKKIYESPDGGKTVYERDFGAPHTERTLIVGNDDYMTDTLSVDLSNHLDEMGIVDSYYEDDTVSIADVTDLTSLTSSTPTVTIGGWDEPYENSKIKKCKKKLPKDLYKKYGIAD